MVKIYKTDVYMTKFVNKDYTRELGLIKETDQMYRVLDDKTTRKLSKGMKMINPAINIKFDIDGVKVFAHVFYESHNKEFAIARLKAKVTDKINQYLLLVDDLKTIKEICKK